MVESFSHHAVLQLHSHSHHSWILSALIRQTSVDSFLNLEATPQVHLDTSTFSKKKKVWGPNKNLPAHVNHSQSLVHSLKRANRKNGVNKWHLGNKINQSDEGKIFQLQTVYMLHCLLLNLLCSSYFLPLDWSTCLSLRHVQQHVGLRLKDDMSGPITDKSKHIKSIINTGSQCEQVCAGHILWAYASYQEIVS